MQLLVCLSNNKDDIHSFIHSSNSSNSVILNWSKSQAEILFLTLSHAHRQNIVEPIHLPACFFVCFFLPGGRKLEILKDAHVAMGRALEICTEIVTQALS